jgi:hypothetical protein
VETALKGKCGTRGYWAPEMVKGDQYLYVSRSRVTYDLGEVYL